MNLGLIISLVIGVGAIATAILRPEILTTIAVWIGNVIHFIGRVLSFAPRWFQVLIFISMATLVLGTAANFMFAMDKVCAGQGEQMQLYSGGLTDVLFAKVLPNGLAQNQVDGGTLNMQVSGALAGLTRFDTATGQLEVGTLFGTAGDLGVSGVGGSEYLVMLPADVEKTLPDKKTNFSVFYNAKICTNAKFWQDNDVITSCDMREAASGRESFVCWFDKTAALLQYEFHYEGEQMKVQITYWGGDGGASLSDCPDVSSGEQQNEHLVKPNNIQVVFVDHVPYLEDDICDVSTTSIFGCAAYRYDLFDKVGYVSNTEYFTFDQLGLPTGSIVAGGESQRLSYMLEKSDDFKLVNGSLQDGGMVTYACADTGDVKVLMYGFDVFSVQTFLVITVILAFLGMIKYLGIF